MKHYVGTNVLNQITHDDSQLKNKNKFTSPLKSNSVIANQRNSLSSKVAEHAYKAKYTIEQVRALHEEFEKEMTRQ